MTNTSPSATEIAQYLQDHPDFFEEHADLFTSLRIPHPQNGKTISFVERQVLSLQSRIRHLESQLSGLVINASDNERISRLLIDWCASLLAENDTYRLPEQIVQGLERLFELPDIVLKLWGLPAINDNHPYAYQASPDLLLHFDTHTLPWCGTPIPETTHWFNHPQASYANLPLILDSGRSVGLLVLGSPDTNRFTPDMGTEFLQTIAALSSAALSRLADPLEPERA